MENLRKAQSLIRKKAKTNNLSFKASLKEKKDLGYTFEIGDGDFYGRFKQAYGAITGILVLKEDEEKDIIIKLALEYLTEVTKQNGYPLLIVNRDVGDVKLMSNLGFFKERLKIIRVNYIRK